MIIILYLIFLINSIGYLDAVFLVENFSGFDGEYIVYTNACEAENIANVDIVKNYHGQILRTDIEFAGSILTSINNVASEKIVLKNTSIDAIKLLLDIDVLEEVIVGNDVILYNCYTDNLNRKVMSKIGYINIQIAVENNMISIGYPYLVDY
jgi:hypothetical protein